MIPLAAVGLLALGMVFGAWTYSRMHNAVTRALRGDA